MQIFSLKEHPGSIRYGLAFVLCCTLIPGVSQSQHDLVFQHYITEENTSIDHVSNIIQDRRGWLWMATMGAGLKRFDGHQFTHYKPDPDDPNSPTNHHIRSICEDKNGHIWMIPGHQGLSVYDPVNDRFTHYRHRPDDSTSLSTNTVYCIIEDNRGDIWAGTAKGLDRLDRKTGAFLHLRADPNDPNSLSDDLVLSLLEDRNGSIWIGTQTGLDRLDPETGAFVHFRHEPGDTTTLSRGGVTALYQDHHGNLWVATAGTGLNYLDSQTGRIRHFRPAPTKGRLRGRLNTLSIFEGKDGTMWFATRGGLFRFDEQTDRFFQYLPDPNNIDKGEHNDIWSIFQDNEGTYWMGANNGGLYSFQWREAPFRHFQHDPSDPFSLGDKQVKNIHKDRDGTYWIGTNKGLDHFDPATQAFTHYSPAPTDSSLWFRSENTVYRILDSGEPFLWIGTRRGLKQFDRQKKVFIGPESGQKTLRATVGKSIESMYEDSSNRLWIATSSDDSSGLFRCDLKADTCIQIWNTSGFDSVVFSIREDPSGNFWLATRTGLVLIDEEHGESTIYRFDPDDPRSIGFSAVNVTFEDSRGRIWIGTGNSLDLLQGTGPHYFEHFTEKDGLSSSHVWSILEDHNDNLWLSGYQKGYTIFNPDKSTFKNLYALDGIKLDGGKAPLFQDPDTKEMWLGTEKGLFIIHPDSLPYNDYVPPVYINRLSTYSRKSENAGFQEVKALWSQNALTLPYHENTFTAEFAVLSYKNPTRNEFAFWLEGVNDDWVNIGGRREATFSNLSPGKYTLRVKGCNNDKVWNEMDVPLQITILPPWWRTNLAYAIYLLLLAGALWSFIRWRLRYIRLHYEREAAFAKATAAEEANEAKSAYLSTVSHELRTPLTSIIGFTKLNKKSLEGKVMPEMQEASPKVQKAARRIAQNLDVVAAEGERLTALINELLDLAKIESGKMTWKMEEVEPAELIKRAAAATAGLFENKPSLQLHTEIPEDLTAIVADRDRIIQVLINLISNAVKFTESGTVALGVKISPSGGGKGEEFVNQGNTTKSGFTSASVALLPPALPKQVWDELSRGTSGAFAGGKKASKELIFFVADTGAGIPPEHHDRIFEKFKQVESDQAGKPKGTGLGLPICKEIVEHHGGRIWVESEPGEGSVFSFSLPGLP